MQPETSRLATCEGLIYQAFRHVLELDDAEIAVYDCPLRTGLSATAAVCAQFNPSRRMKTRLDDLSRDFRNELVPPAYMACAGRSGVRR